MVLQLNTIIGSTTDSELAARLHDLKHQGAVEYVVLDQENARRQRLRTTTDQGTECAIALPRDQKLSNGAVLFLTGSRAIVVRTRSEEALILTPRDTATAIELGYFAGNMHWRVRFEEARLKILLEGPRQDYLDRLHPFISSERVDLLEDE